MEAIWRLLRVRRLPPCPHPEGQSAGCDNDNDVAATNSIKDSALIGGHNYDQNPDKAPATEVASIRQDMIGLETIDLIATQALLAEKAPPRFKLSTEDKDLLQTIITG